MKLRFLPHSVGISHAGSSLPRLSRVPRLALPHLPTLAPTEAELRRHVRAGARWLAEHAVLVWQKLVAWAIAFPGPSTRPHAAASILLIGATVCGIAGACYLTTVHPASPIFQQQWALGFTFAICAWVQCIAAALTLRR